MLKENPKVKKREAAKVILANEKACNRCHDISVETIMRYMGGKKQIILEIKQEKI